MTSYHEGLDINHFNHHTYFTREEPLIINPVIDISLYNSSNFDSSIVTTEITQEESNRIFKAIHKRNKQLKNRRIYQLFEKYNLNKNE